MLKQPKRGKKSKSPQKRPKVKELKSGVGRNISLRDADFTATDYGIGLQTMPYQTFVTISKYLNTSEYKSGKRRGLRIRGRVPTDIVFAAEAGASSNSPALAFYSVPGTVAGSTFGGYRISPLSIFQDNSPEDNICRQYRMYRFDSVKYYAQSVVQTNTGGSYVFGANDDGAMAGADPTTTLQIYMMDGSYGSAVWVPATGSDQTRNLAGGSSDWYFIDTNDSTDAGLRQSFQQVIFARWNFPPNTSAGVPITGAIVLMLWMEFDLVIIDPIGYWDITTGGSADRSRMKQLALFKQSRQGEDVKSRPRPGNDDKPAEVLVTPGLASAEAETPPDMESVVVDPVPSLEQVRLRAAALSREAKRQKK